MLSNTRTPPSAPPCTRQTVPTAIVRPRTRERGPPMSRLGTWEPAGSDLEARIDRMESLADIRQLPYRYALALDSRDMDALVTLFVPDVQVGRDQRGRDALREWF